MSDDTTKSLAAITEVLGRIETKIDASATRFEQHVAEDALMAQDVRRLAKQHGFIAGAAAAFTAIGAALTFGVKRILGH